MSFQDFVPAQEKALHYTQAFAKVHPLPLHLCGHSKGGNLAVYAASRCLPEEQRRILAVYNHDGPGFTANLMNDPGYREMVPRIHTYIPQSSVIGMLLEHQEPYILIKSRQVSILQHELYSWEVLGPAFIRVAELGEDSRFLNQTIKTWLAGKTRSERNEFVDAMFDLLGTGDVDDAREIILPWNVLSYLRTLNEDEEMRRILFTELGDLIHTASEIRKQKDQLLLGE